MRKTLTGRVLLMTAVLALVSAWASAGTIVNWGGDYVVSGDSPPLLTGGYNASTGYFNAISPSKLYTGPVVGGRLSVSNSNSEMVHDAAGDRMVIKAIDWALVLFQKPTFLDGGASGTVGFDSSDTISIGINSNIGRDQHLVIRSGNTYYISGAIVTGTGDKSYSPTAVSWFAYDPVNAPTVIGSSASPVVAGVIGDIQAVGIYSKKNTTGSEAFRFDSFVVTAVPEPATVAVLTLGALVQAARRRRT